MNVDAETLVAMLEHAPGFICLTDTEARVVYLNRVGSGYRLDEVVGKFWFDLLTDEQAEVARAGFARALDTGEPQSIENYVDTRERGRRWYLTAISVVPNRAGDARGLLTIITDITERREAEYRLKSSERQRIDQKLRLETTRTQKVLNTTLDGYLLIDRQALIVDVNDAYCRLVGRPRAAILGTPLLASAACAPGAPTLSERLQAMFSRDVKQRFEIQLATPDGRVLDADASAAVLHLEDAPLLVMFVRDVTAKKRADEERERLEAQLHQQQKLQSLGTLASGVAHEINNPIQGILGFAQLIRHRARGEEEIHKFATEIVGECKHIARIVNDLLTFARQEKELSTPSRIEEIVEATLSLIRASLSSDRIHVEVDVPQDLPSVSCRSHQIQQVIMNLLTNARDALNERYESGHPDKRLRIEARPFMRAGVDWMRIMVEDHGIGVEPGIADRIFDPFFTTKERAAGTGLGLSVSHGIAKDHRGHLRLESDPGRSTRFYLELPVDEGMPEATVPPPEQHDVGRGS